MSLRPGDIASMADSGCLRCCGYGRDRGAVCECVYRRVFRAVYWQWVMLRRLDSGDLEGRSLDWVLDVEMIARRHLSGADWRLWRMRYQLGADYGACGARLGLSEAQVYRALRRIRTTLGRVWSETQPWAVWPLDEYRSWNYKSAGRGLAMAA